MDMRMRKLQTRIAAWALTFCMAFNSTAFQGAAAFVYAAQPEITAETQPETEAEISAEATPSDAAAEYGGKEDKTATASDALYDEDGFLLDGEVADDIQDPVLSENTEYKTDLQELQKQKLPEQELLQPELLLADGLLEGEEFEGAISLKELDQDLPSSEELLQAYLESFLPEDKLLSGRFLEAPRNPRRRYLTDHEKHAYDIFSDLLKKVAAGEQASTVVELRADDFGIDGMHDVLEEYGYEGSMYNEANVQEIYTIIWDTNFQKVLNAVLKDHPYEAYWIDKGGFVTYRGYLPGVRGAHEIDINKTRGFQFRFYVAEGYKAEEDFTADTAKTGAASAAVQTALAIVKEAAGLPDHEKLAFYRDRICSLVSYDSYAANNGKSEAGTEDPWQVISVFDGNPETNVVCEGYSKAFKYLCDLTEFESGSVECYLATGWLNGGAHMWNVVAMDDGRNYMVDVTNSDAGTDGSRAGVFLNGYKSGSVADGYRFSNMTYRYDNETTSMFSEDILTLSAADYDAAGKRGVYVDRLVLNQNSVWGGVGESITLSAEAEPYYADDITVRWSVSDSSIAELDRTEGSAVTLTLKKLGKTTVTAVAADRGTVKAECDLEVDVHVETVTLDSERVTLKPGETHKLTATVLPENARNRKLKWASDRKQSATVTQDGTVTALANGIAVITATSEDGGIEAECKVFVQTPVTGIVFEKETLEIKTGETITLDYTVIPEDASNKGVRLANWLPDAVEVKFVGNNKSITVTGKRWGSGKLVLTTDDGGFTAECKVSVTEQVPVTGISFPQDEVTIAQGETLKLVPEIVPENASNKKIYWKSSSRYVTVADDGTVTGVSAGKAVITAETQDGLFKAYCTVHVAVPVTGITLDESEITLKKGEEHTLIASVLPQKATNRNVRWSSSNPAVAEVNGNGCVEAKDGGTAVITAETEEGGYTASCTVTVPVPVTGVKVTPETMTLRVGESGKLTAEALPSNAADRRLWWSSGSAFATVSDDGVVMALHKGTAKIYVRTVDGNYSAVCTVTILQPASGVSLDKNELLLKAGETAKLTAAVVPENADNRNVSWSSSNPSVAEVSAQGTVTAKDNGSAVITVTAKDGGYTAECRVTVNTPVTGVSLERTSLKLAVGDSYTLSAVLSPEKAANRKISWSSSAPGIAVVDQTGKVTALKPGTAEVTVTTEDGGFTAACLITAAYAVPVTGVKLDRKTLEIEQNKTIKLTASVFPENATHKNLVWSSSSSDVSVSVDGSVTGKVFGGYAVITVRTEDGGFTDTCEVNVVVLPESLSLDREQLKLRPEETARLTAAIKPVYATNRNISWSSSNPSVAVVAADGTVTGVADGTAVITAVTEAGGLKASCTVTVDSTVIPVRGIRLKDTHLEVKYHDPAKVYYEIIPADATNQKVTFTTTDRKVAAVDAYGLFWANAVGTAYITVTTEDGAYSGTCKVTVAETVVPVTGITLTSTEKTMTEGDSGYIGAIPVPSNATNRAVFWTSSDDNIVTVDEEGNLSAIKPGTAVITGRTEDGDYTAECRVTVNRRVYHVTSVSLDKAAQNLTEGEQFLLTTVVLPENADNKKVSWSSSNSTVAAVDQNGAVTAKKAGTAVITVTTADGGKTDTCRVTVKAKIYPVTGVTLDKTAETLTVGGSFSLTARVLPANASNRKVFWSSSDAEVAAVNQSGTVTAKKTGTAVITVTTTDGGKTASCRVTVNPKIYRVTEVTLNRTAAEMTEGDSLVLTAAIGPVNATNKNISWSSSDSTVAVVDQSGTVTAKKAGSVVITVTTEDRGKTASCTVTVKAKAVPQPVPDDPVTAFVKRLYDGCFGRPADQGGLDFWVSGLKNSKTTGAKAAKFFFESGEMQKLGLSDEEFINRLYNVMMGRAADAGGRNFWLERAQNGMSRRWLIKSFIDSQEFTNICADYGITKGSVSTTENRDKNYGVTSFIARIYTKALDRKYDTGGLNYWTGYILSVASAKRKTEMINVAMRFLHSKEFTDRNLNNTEYLKVLYRTFFGREADKGGLEYWLGSLNSGKSSRDSVLKSFANSGEFARLMKQYGIQ